ncbi:50S ribosomal protein L11 methyltransferase [Cognatiyoonia sp. IB215446]|uniref:50S ribosomal protein L11 methyltransferase n=1 Tax=Cognatiyoonia sp. IB215446 TaxID=3097355 RepID=UPI002A119574|nr:50S ribosomal protein L11 methyltransferase [Cognatiyoonia sp. IB215446]MDX8347244.1 50S ribosomal protein L11 methyltransferase [Cognatiyoonia sp. IB215446]
MTTFTALTTLSGETAAYALSDALEAVVPEPTGIGVFEIEDGSGLWEVGAYFSERPDVAALAVLSALHGARPFSISEVPDQDWVSKVQRDLPPVAAGRFFVYGAHDADNVPPGKHALLIEAAMAFGTGHHGTTLGCLRAFDRLLDKGFAGGRIVDVGCGTAVLAMAAAKIFSDPVWASDIDPVAVEVAAANVAANGLSGRVECFTGAGFAAPALQEHAPFDLVFANILKGPLVDLAPDMARFTADDGYVILSGILNEQAQDVTAIYQRNGFNLLEKEEIVDWTTLLMGKNPPV